MGSANILFGKLLMVVVWVGIIGVVMLVAAFSMSCDSGLVDDNDGR